MARLRYNGLVAELAGSGLTDSATSITFAAALTHSGGTAVPTLSGDYIPLTILDSDGVPKEVVYLTAYTTAGTTGTISRGMEGTTGVAHSAGVALHQSHLTADVYADPVDDPGQWGGLDLGYDVEFNSSGSSLPSGWAWVNQGTATFTRTRGRGLITEPTAASGNNLRMIERAIPTESSFEATVKLNGRLWPPAGTFGHFIHLRDSVSGKITILGANGAGSSTWSLGRWDWSNPTTSSATTLTTTDFALMPRFWRFRKNSATSWDFQLSLDGVVWDTHTAAHNVETFLGTAPTHIGWGLWRNNVVTSAACSWFRVR